MVHLPFHAHCSKEKLVKIMTASFFHLKQNFDRLSHLNNTVVVTTDPNLQIALGLNERVQ